MRLGGVWRVLLLVALLLESSAAFAGIGSLRQRWPQDKQRLSICFFGGSAESRGMIARIAHEWTRDISLSFDFGPEPGFNSCGGEQKFDVRVGFEAKGSWSYIGSDAGNVPQDRPTINLQGLGERFDVRARRAVLHEFGHVLGLLHEEQNPEAGCREELDLDKIRAMGLTQQALDSLLAPVTSERVASSSTELEQRKERTVPNNGEYISTGFDPKSVMRLFLGAAYFKAGEQSKCNGPSVDALSEADLKLAKLMYPPKPADVSASEGKFLTIRLFGVLAPEHYGYILSALYAKGKLELKKHVLLVSQTIEKVVQEERLTPRGVTAVPTEEFLCQINPHICVKAHGKNRWSNTAATKNYVPSSDLKCPDKSLPKFILCLPNVRMEPYSVLYNINFDARHDSLRGLVVNRFDGCENWDDKCRALIKTMNVQLSDVFTSGPELLPAKFSGELHLPGKAYRLVIKYNDEADRLAIEEAVNGIIESRAKELRIPKDRVSIQVTYPAGAPRGLAMPHGLPRMTGEPPVHDILWRPEFVKSTYKNLVDVGIWDLGADTEHCLLKGVVHVTRPRNVRISTSTLPPDKAPHCGDARTNGYEQSLPFDHGTGVAGIIAAHSSDSGAVTGMIPGVKIWAWQVVSTVQFEGGAPGIINAAAEYSLSPRVINVSQSYPTEPGRRSNLENLLFGEGDNNGLDQIFLIVTAAGDVLEGSKRVGHKMEAGGTECTIYPACWSNAKDEANGLLSVVALNAAEDGLLKDDQGTILSNYGSAFDVAALGVAKTTFHGGWVGTMVGSSVAAPHVAGLAGVMFAKGRELGLQLTVQDVKQRILFTSDMTPELKSVSRYGRINPWKALSFEDDWIIADAWTCPTAPCWTKVKVDRRAARTVQVSFKDGMTELNTPKAEAKISFNNIRSIKAEGEGRYTVIYYDSDERRLKRLTEALIDVGTDKPFVNKDGGNTPFPKQGLREYVSCTFLKSCKE
jgi:subtilisin family serine protease